MACAPTVGPVARRDLLSSHGAGSRRAPKPSRQRRPLLDDRNGADQHEPQTKPEWTVGYIAHADSRRWSATNRPAPGQAEGFDPPSDSQSQNRTHVALGGFPARVQNQGSRAKRAESAADAESGRPVRPVTSRSVARNSNTRDRRRRKEAARAVPVVVMQLCAPQAAADRPRMTHAADRALRISEGSPCGRWLGGCGRRQ